MKIRCPVALCLWEGKTYDFWKHIEEYKTTWKGVMDNGYPRSESHERWALFFYKDIWNNPDLTEKVKWTNIAVAYVEKIKSQSKMAKHQWKPSNSPDIEMHDGKIVMNGQEYTPDEFSKVMSDIRVSQRTKPPFETIKDISGDLRITHEGKEYTIEEFRKLQREKLEMLKK